MLRFAYQTATTLDQAVTILSGLDAGAKILAGGTDLMPQIKAHVVEPGAVLALGNIPEMQVFEHEADGSLRIGALVKMRRIENDALVKSRFTAVAQGAKLVGSIQIRNLATLGGNICNAAPSADVVPALVAFDGEAVVVGSTGRRSVPLAEFFLGPRRTVLENGELLVEVRLPAPLPNTGSHYLRHTPRMEMDIAVAGSAAAVSLANGRITKARICLASVAPTPVRATSAEAILTDAEPSDDVIRRAAAAAADDCRPISDVRGSDEYRRHLVTVLTERSLRAALAQAQQA